MAEANYPLNERPETIHANSGRPLHEITPEALADLSIADLQISGEALRAQAAVARAAGYGQLAENLTRAAELTAVPNAEVLQMYDALRPGRASYEQLIALAEKLANQYNAPICAAFVQEAAEVYRERGLLRR
jgi:propanediol dehydratase small subunit